MKTVENTDLLKRKRAIDAERRERAIERRLQQTLRDTTPGVATPATVMNAAWRKRVRR